MGQKGTHGNNNNNDNNNDDDSDDDNNKNNNNNLPMDRIVWGRRGHMATRCA